MIEHLQRARRHRDRAAADPCLPRRPHLLEHGLNNYWGYNTLSFFAPEQRYAADNVAERVPLDRRRAARRRHRGHPRRRLQPHLRRQPSRARRCATAASTTPSYYWLCPTSRAIYENFTGTGNALKLAHPRVLQMVMDSLRYWVEAFHVDGFRFDLASTLGRAPAFDRNAPFFAAVRAGPGARQRQDDRRAVGYRARRLSGRRLPARLVGMERRLSQDAAPLLARRRQPARRHGARA